VRIIECEQRSPEWFEAKLGIPSSSSFDKIITSKGELSKQAQGYMYTLAAERISRVVVDDKFQSAAMEEGIRREQEARQVYAMLRDVDVTEVGFCVRDFGPGFSAGCSPDGLVGDEGGLELKNPMGKTHVEYLLNRCLPTDYIQQIQGSLWVTQRKWWDFVSHYPGLPMLIVRVFPDPKIQAALDGALLEFCAGLERTCQQIPDECQAIEGGSAVTESGDGRLSFDPRGGK